MQRHRSGLIVTGEGEAQFIPRLFRSLQTEHACAFEVIRRIGQRSPRSGPVPALRVTGTALRIPSKDEEEIGLAALRHMHQWPGSFVILLDDLEWDRREKAQSVFGRYREALDAVLGTCGLSHAAAVHFFVMMLEAYYLACPDALQSALGIDFPQPDGDVESLRNPVSAIKDRFPAFDKIEHGRLIVEKLDIPAALSDPATCASLRTLFAWCVKAMAGEFGMRYRLADGELFWVTQMQIEALPDSPPG